MRGALNFKNERFIYDINSDAYFTYVLLYVPPTSLFYGKELSFYADNGIQNLSIVNTIHSYRVGFSVYASKVPIQDVMNTIVNMVRIIGLKDERNKLVKELNSMLENFNKKQPLE